MGLRINTNVTSLRALRTLRVNDRHQATSLERLSTGLRINRASDDPSGLIISEQLRGQLRALNQAVDNSQNASNMISIADSALQEVSNLLNQVQDSIVFALNSGGATPDQIAAEQFTVDQAVAAIDRIANTTRFGDRSLLNGNSGYQVVGVTSDIVNDVTIRTMDFPGNAATRTISLSINRQPQRATINVSGVANAAGSVTIRITGPRGSQDIVFSSASTLSTKVSAINTVAGVTGVYASGPGTSLLLRSEEFGNNQFIKLETVTGTLSSTGGNFSVVSGTGVTLTADGAVGSTLTAGENVFDRGLDGQVTFDGVVYTAVGRHFSILAPTAQFSFSLDPDPNVSTTAIDDDPPISTTAISASFTVANTGLNFQVNETPLPSDRIGLGIQAMTANQLGKEGIQDILAHATLSYAGSAPTKFGFLNSVRSGQGNDLTQNSGNANEIIKTAITQANTLRGFLGAVQAQTLEPNINTLSVEIENLSASLSTLRDLDFAAETANFTRTQILFQSGIAVLASSNLIPQSVLTLLR